ncbi:uroporphyrinogen-III C-methyltransferase [Denitrificimonas caeni]|uniref:uroporphyrinogen-III C-methyltransferase n=1 Tax=Denitrificimonas caeni TaxID=521720 RepID=UPI001964649A|nr:uroporphyrinogen-III C-methyltransferase [Denitrificimonas caeni]
MTQSSEKPDLKAATAAEPAQQNNTSKPEQPANKESTVKPTAAKPSASTATPASKPTTSSSGKGLAVLALLFGLGGLGAGVWSVLQIQASNDLSAQQQQQLSSMLSQTKDLAGREQQLSQTLAQMPSASQLQQGRELLASVQAEQQLLSQRLETILGASRQDWRLAEAEHLLRMASLRLTALHDTNSARFLLQAADQILMEQDDPAAFAAREQLANSIAALNSSSTLDRTGLFVQLGALHQQASQLTHLAPEFIQSQGQQADVAQGDGPGRWAQWWEQISRYVRIDFNASEQVQPLLAGQSLTQVRLALGLALEQAQWAALNGATEVYQQALQQALAILEAHFSVKDSSVSSLRTQLSELHEQKVSEELPDLNAALITLQAYINTRSTPQEPGTEESN